LYYPRATHRHHSIRDPLTELRLLMRQLAQTRIRYGYRRIRVLLIRDGWKGARSWCTGSIARKGLDCE
jgi:putative transposase